MREEGIARIETIFLPDYPSILFVAVHTDAGLVGSVLTQPFQLPEVRAGLVEALSLAGFPQLLLRLGHPQFDHDEEK